MKVSGFWAMLVLLVTALMLLGFSDSKCSPSTLDEFFAGGNGALAMTAVSRKLKEQSHNPSTNNKRNVGGKVNLDDYRPINPVPSSKASIKPGPIEHGSPLNPYIPKPKPSPPPPAHPKNGA